MSKLTMKLFSKMFKFKNKINSNFFLGTIAYSNVASLQAKFNDVVVYVTDDQPTFLILSETWLSSLITDSLISLHGYTVFRKDRENRGGGVCIYVSNLILANFKVEILESDTGNIDSLFIKVYNSSLTFVLACIYRPPKSSLVCDRTLFHVLSRFYHLYDKIFVFGDFNMPSIDWSATSYQSHDISSQLLIDMINNSHVNQIVSQPTR